MKTEDREVLGRELNQARSKPDTVDLPVRTARIFVRHYNSTQYSNTVFSIFPSSRPTSHLRCGHVEVRGQLNGSDNCYMCVFCSEITSVLQLLITHM